SASYPKAAREARAAAAAQASPEAPTLAQIDRTMAAQQSVMRKQLKWAWCGLFGLLIALGLPYDLLRSKGFALWALGIALALLLLVLAMGTDQGRAARRWLELGPISLQPSEFAKFALVIYLAQAMAQMRDRVKRLDRFARLVAVVGLVSVLVVIEPHLGATMVVLGAALAVLWVGGADKRHLGGIMLAAMLLGLLSVSGHSYQGGRLRAWLHPERDEVLGYQAVHCGTALARGGLIGRGIGHSIEKFYYLPECYTDSVFAIVGEETGLLGTALLLGLFSAFAWRGLRIAARCPDPFGRLLAVGVTAVIFLQAMLNMGVTSGLLPQTGVGLPFISYGGSSLCCFMGACGLLLNVSRLQPPPRERPERARVVADGRSRYNG
ncbi:MAG: FtsW/RodA/SpoVE family cell cycle protein, partial [Armatimonadetes bacterium]|nr:FtsW/RodA/SpoVE family cell cycle protein [Armatimonadota bacterium]